MIFFAHIMSFVAGSSCTIIRKARNPTESFQMRCFYAFTISGKIINYGKCVVEIYSPRPLIKTLLLTIGFHI